MSNTKNMHYLSQMITRNFLPKNGLHTFWMYDPSRGKLETRNIDRLFSKYRPWGQEFEALLSGNQYENRIAPLLKELNQKTMERGRILTRTGVEEPQFNAVSITDKIEYNLLSKLIFQIVLLQRSGEKPEPETEKITEELFKRDFNIRFNILLVEIHPLYICPPLILTDGMLFFFICPDDRRENLGHMGFMFPISEKRFLLYISNKDDFIFFCRKYHNINFLNLCRIEQHEKKCVIALAKTERNEAYMKHLIQEIPFFKSHEPVSIRTTREWE